MDSLKKNNREHGAAFEFSRSQALGAYAAAAVQTWLGWSPFRYLTEGPNAPAKAVSTGQRNARAAKVFLAFVVLTLACLLIAGKVMQTLLSDAGTIARYLAGAGGGITLMALVTHSQNILLIFRSLRNYVHDGEQVDLFSVWVKYAATVLTFLFSLFAILMPFDGENGTHAVALPTDLTRPALLSRGVERVDYFPFLFGLADGPEAWKHGVHLNDQQRNDVARLASTLKACVGDDPNQDVVVEIVGYADSNEFSQAARVGQSSDELNRQAANRRAQALFEELQKALGEATSPSTVQIAQVIEWAPADPTAMTRSPRYFKVEPLSKTGGEDQGYFNRRAEIALIRAGVCERYEAT